MLSVVIQGVVILGVVMLGVVILGVVMLGVVMLSVVASSKRQLFSAKKIWVKKPSQNKSFFSQNSNFFWKK
jgi:hypothetical protein